MYIHEEKKIAFIAHPRTASVAIAATLCEMGFTQVGSHHQFKEVWCLGHTFSVVRNPFDMMVSWYYFRARECGLSFESWLRVFLDDPPYYIKHGLFFGVYLCTDTLRYENLQEEFDQFTKKVGLPQTEIMRSNVTKRREGRDFMDVHTEMTLERVRVFFRNEIDQFDYHQGVRNAYPLSN